MRAPMPASRARLHAAALFGYVCVAVAFVWPLPMHFASALPGSPGGDTGVYVWNLWVFRHEVVAHSRFPFFTLEILGGGTPPVPLTLHNYTTFANVLAFPLIPWLGPVATFNLLLVASSVASAYAMFFFARARLGDASAAWAAGLLFGFSPFASARMMEHFSLVQAAPLPVFAWLLYRIWGQPTAKLAAAAGAVVAWAYLCDPYYAVYCLLMTVFTVVNSMLLVERNTARPGYPHWAALLDLALLCVGGLIVGILIRGGGQVDFLGIRVSMTRLYNPVLLFTVLAVIRIAMILRARIVWRFPSLPPLRVTMTAAIACAALLSPVLFAMGATLSHTEWISPKVYWRSSAPGVDLLAFLAPNPLHPAFGHFTRGWLTTLPNGFVENVASIPWVAIGVIAAAAVWKRYRLPRPWLAYTAIFVLLALGPFLRVGGVTTYVPGPWALIRYMPVIGAARMPTRFTVVAMLGVAMLLAFALKHFRERSARPNLLAGVVIVLLLFELLPAPRVLHSARVPTIFSIVAEDPRQVRVLHLPFGVRDGLSSRGNFSADSQFFQTFHEKSLVGGYLSRLPDGQVERFRKIPILRVLMRLSEERDVDAATKAEALQTAAEQRERLRVGYVVVSRSRTSEQLLEFAKEAFGLRLLAVDGEWELYAAALQENANNPGLAYLSVYK